MRIGPPRLVPRKAELVRGHGQFLQSQRVRISIGGQGPVAPDRVQNAVRSNNSLGRIRVRVTWGACKAADHIPIGAAIVVQDRDRVNEPLWCHHVGQADIDEGPCRASASASQEMRGGLRMKQGAQGGIAAGKVHVIKVYLDVGVIIGPVIRCIPDQALQGGGAGRQGNVIAHCGRCPRAGWAEPSGKSIGGFVKRSGQAGRG